MRRFLLTLLLLLLPVWGWAQTTSTSTSTTSSTLILSSTGGTLTSAQTTTGVSQTQIDTKTPPGPAYNTAAFCYKLNSGTSAVVQVEYRHRAASSSWSAVASTSNTIDATTPTVCVGILGPQGIYRTNVTACSSCNVTTTYELGAQLIH